MDDDCIFCTTCGKKLESGAGYCPACGAAAASVPSADNQYRNTDTREAKDKLQIAMILLLAGAIISLIMGAFVISSVDSLIQMLADMMSPGADFKGTYGFTQQDFEDVLIQSGYMMIVCGVLCLIACVTVMKRFSWPLTFILAIMATVMGFISAFFGGFFGLLVVWYVYKYKDAFGTGA